MERFFSRAGLVFIGVSIIYCVIGPKDLPAAVTLPLLLFTLGAVGSDRKRLALVPGKMLLPWGLWAGAVLLSLFSAVDPDYSLKQIRHDLLSPILLFFATLMLVNRPSQIKVFWLVFLAAVVIQSIFGMVEYLTEPRRAGMSLMEGFGYFRSMGSFQSVHGYLLTLFISYPFWLYALLIFRGNKQRLILAVGLAIVFVGWLLGFGRIEMILLPFFLALTYLLPKLPRKAMTLGLAGLLLGAFALTAVIASLNTELPGRDLSVRQIFWNLSANYIKERPFAGIGFGYHTYDKFFLSQPEEVLRLTDFPVNSNGHILDQIFRHHPHNLLVNTWLTTGLQGLLAMMFLAFRIFQAACPPDRALRSSEPALPYFAYAFCLAAIGILITNLSDLLLAGNFLKLTTILSALAISAVRLMDANFKPFIE